MNNLEPMLPFLVVCLSTLLIAGGVLAYNRHRYAASLMFVVILGVVLRLFAATDACLHPWDESFHAVVAKHCMTTPLKPVLYRAPALPYDYRDWMANSVWLHKPPLALWLIAGSLSVLGVNEFAVRFPSVVMSSLLIFLTYGIGSLLWDRRNGLLAAALCAVNCHLIDLASGRDATDHVDTILITLVTAGAYLALMSSSSQKRTLLDVSVGVVAGAAYLTKGLPGLFVIMLWLVATVARSESSRADTRRFLIVVIAAWVVAVPWNAYTRLAYPRESSWESLYAIRHIFETLEEHAHPWYYYLRRMGTWLGPASYIAVFWALGRLATQRFQRQLLIVLAWFAVPHAVFSLVATKMPAYVTMTASAGFLLIAFFVIDASDVIMSRFNGRWHRCLLLSLCLVLICLPLKRTMKRLHLTGEYDRQPAWARQLRHLAKDCTNPDAVVFAVPHHIEAMFYGDFTAYDFLPSRNEIEAILAAGREVVVFDQGDLPAWVREMEGVRVYRPTTTASGNPR